MWRSKASGQQWFSLDEAVSEALCFGWIDSTVRRLGDGRSALRFTPRRPGGTWSRLNRQRVAALVAQELMTEAGQRVVDAARRDGSWTTLEPVDDLCVPDDLDRALRANPTARSNFHAFPPSIKKLALGWIATAKRPQTRATRIAETVRLAADNRSVADRSTAVSDGDRRTPAR
jgi:uncharacterized protein YdeI (YjbR/CyaY-like superfamily)